MGRRLRLLPIVIFAAALTLTFKVGSLWHDFRVDVRASSAAEGAAKPEANKSGAEKPASDKPAADAKVAKDKKAEAGTGPGAPEAAKHSAGEKKPEAGQATTEPEKTSPRAPGTFDPLTATDAEIELLGKLAARREELDRRAGELDLREGMLKATERRLDERLTELKSIQATIEALLKKHDAEEEAKLKSLVKIYENMKPKDAARIFEKLELPILLDVIERMREAKVAPVLADMDPSKAKTVTAALAERRNLPKQQASKDAERQP